MILKKNFIQNVFEETLMYFNDLIVQTDHEVRLRYESREEHLKQVKNNPMIQQQIQIGMYKDIDKEYVAFGVVYEMDKAPLRKLMGIPYKLTICYEIAKDKLKPFKPHQAKEYIKHVIAHELTHIYEDLIKVHKPYLWEEAMEKSKNVEALAKEELANDVAFLLTKKDLVEEVENELWKVTKVRTGRIMKRLGRD